MNEVLNTDEPVCEPEPVIPEPALEQSTGEVHVPDDENTNQENQGCFEKMIQTTYELVVSSEVFHIIFFKYESEKIWGKLTERWHSIDKKKLVIYRSLPKAFN